MHLAFSRSVPTGTSSGRVSGNNLDDLPLDAAASRALSADLRRDDLHSSRFPCDRRFVLPVLATGARGRPGRAPVHGQCRHRGSGTCRSPPPASISVTLLSPSLWPGAPETRSPRVTAGMAHTRHATGATDSLALAARLGSTGPFPLVSLPGLTGSDRTGHRSARRQRLSGRGWPRRRTPGRRAGGVPDRYHSRPAR